MEMESPTHGFAELTLETDDLSGLGGRRQVMRRGAAQQRRRGVGPT